MHHQTKTDKMTSKDKKLAGPTIEKDTFMEDNVYATECIIGKLKTVCAPDKKWCKINGERTVDGNKIILTNLDGKTLEIHMIPRLDPFAIEINIVEVIKGSIPKDQFAEITALMEEASEMVRQRIKSRPENKEMVMAYENIVMPFWKVQPKRFVPEPSPIPVSVAHSCGAHKVDYGTCKHQNVWHTSYCIDGVTTPLRVTPCQAGISAHTCASMASLYQSQYPLLLEKFPPDAK